MVTDFGLEYIVFDEQCSMKPIKGYAPVYVVGDGDVKIPAIPFGPHSQPGFLQYFGHGPKPKKSLPEGILDEQELRVRDVRWDEVLNQARRMPVMTVYCDWEGSYCCSTAFKQVDDRWYCYRNVDEGILSRMDAFFGKFEKLVEMETVTAHDLIDKLPPREESKLYDGRGSKANRYDISRIADGTAFDSRHKNWSQYPQMADVESLSYVFKSYQAVKHCIEIAEHTGDESLDIDSLWKEALITGCSALRGSAPDYRHKEQIEDRYYRLLSIKDKLHPKAVSVDPLSRNSGKNKPVIINNSAGISVSFGLGLITFESGGSGAGNISIGDIRIGRFGYIEAAINSGDELCRDSGAAELKVTEKDSGVLIECRSKIKGIDIIKSWTVYSDSNRLRYEAVVMQKSVSRLRMGGIELDPRFNNSRISFNRISDSAPVPVKNNKAENLTLVHAGNGLLNYSSGGRGLTLIVDKKVSAPGFMRLDTGGYFLMAEQASEIELPVHFKDYPKLRLIISVNDYENIEQQDLELAQNILIEPLELGEK